MQTRDPMFPKFLISKRLSAFKQPPCEPPKGKDVLERYFDVLYEQPPNKRNGSDAAFKVAKELLSLWQLGDGRIPLRCEKTVKKAIEDFRTDFNYIRNETKKTRKVYQDKVRP